MVGFRQGWTRLSWRRAAFIKLPPYVFIAFVLVAAFTSLAVGTRTLGTFAPPAPDLFADYTSFFPGHPRDALMSYGFTCPSHNIGTYYGSSPEICVLRPVRGRFVMIRAFVSQGQIQQIEFLLRHNSLRLIDLVAQWNLPQSIVQENVKHFFWDTNGNTVEAVVIRKHSSILSPLHSIAIAITVQTDYNRGVEP